MDKTFYEKCDSYGRNILCLESKGEKFTLTLNTATFTGDTDFVYWLCDNIQKFFRERINVLEGSIERDMLIRRALTPTSEMIAEAKKDLMRRSPQ